jgi:glycosyltransferase involved in cell wall biosynthesis
MTVSVVMPVFDGMPFLPQAIASIQNQTFRDWEVIAIDDGSADGSAECLRTLARTDARIRVFHRAHEGLVASLNAGLKIARGQFIARMDADDESLPSRFEQQVACLRRHPKIGVVGSRVAFGGDPVAQAGYATHVDWLNTIIEPEQIDRAQFIESPFAHPSVMFRRNMVEEHGAYRAGDFPEDYELWLRWLAGGVRMAKVPEVLLLWRDSPHRLSRTDRRYAPESFFRLKAPFLARWLESRVGARRQLLVWGAGRLTRRRVEFLQACRSIDAFVDVDPRKQGRRPCGRRVLSLDQIPDPRLAFVVGYVASRGARDLQREFLSRRGFVEGRDFVFAA